MNQPPLNPDALDETALANLIAWKSLPFGATQFVKLDANAAHKVIELLRPHLAAALPEVTNVEELEALPAGSIVSSGGREFYKTSYIEYPWILPYGVDRFGSEYLAKHSKVTVMHLPEFES